MTIRNRIKELRNVLASSLKPNPKNWRTHPQAQSEAMRGILAEIGYADSLIARELPDGSLMLIDGHLRAETTPDEMVPVQIVDLTEAEADKLLLSLDPLAAMAESNAAAMQQLCDDAETNNAALQAMWDEMQANVDQPDVEIVEDEVPEPPADPITKAGDLWILGDHRVMCGDSTKAEDVERLMAGAKADLCFTSPPYSDQREYNGGELSEQSLARFICAASPYCELFAVNLGMSRKNNEVNDYWNEYISVARSSGLKFLSWNIWDRSGCGYTVGQATAMFTVDHEWILVFGWQRKELNRTVENKDAGRRTEGTRRNKDGSTTAAASVTSTHRQLGTVFRCDVVKSRNAETKDHPAVFPVGLPAAYIEACCDSVGSVYDPFCGSGTTLIAAEQLGRKCYGMEISPAYCDVIVKRWETLTGKKATLEITDGKTRPAKTTDSAATTAGKSQQAKDKRTRAKA